MSSDLPCVTNHKHVITGAGNNTTQYSPCSDTKSVEISNHGVYTFDDPTVTGLPITTGFNREKSDIKSLFTNLPFTGVTEVFSVDNNSDKIRTKSSYVKNVLQGPTTIYTGTRLTQEKVYNNGKLAQFVIYTDATEVEHVIGRLTWIYTYPDNDSLCHSSRGSNAPCKESVNVGKVIVGNADMLSYGSYSLVVKDELGNTLMTSDILDVNKDAIKYFHKGKLWAKLETVNGYVSGNITSYSPINGELSVIDYSGKIPPTWNRLWSLLK